MTATETVVLSATATDWAAIDPTPEQIAAELASRVARADLRQRSRTLDGVDAPGLAAAAHGIYEWGGWGVPNSYRGRATTSVAGVAWWTSPAGRVHVRVRANRVQAPSSSFAGTRAHAFPHAQDSDSAADCFAAVHPAAAPVRVLVKHRKGKGRLPAELLSLLDGIAADPLDLSARSALCDWLAEHPGTPDAPTPEAARAGLDAAATVVGAES